MRIRILPALTAIMLLCSSPCAAQDDAGPVMIKINRIVFSPGNKYVMYVPTFEFHMFFQKEFNILRSTVNADYDYRRQDMGFGMSHMLFKYAVNPGVSVDDNLYFREVFSDSTGIWRRKQAVTPYLMHQINDNASVGLAFKLEREWSPNRRMGTKIVSNHDRSLKIYYLIRQDDRNDKMLYASLERSYKIISGQFNYFLLEILAKYERELGQNIRYHTIANYRGNLTPQRSPLFFLGGRSNLIGYENDELWGRKAVYCQNLLEFSPFPEFEYIYSFIKVRRISLLAQFDIGRVTGSSHILGYKPQTDAMKLGLGTGVGFNTDLPYMPGTDIHFLLAVPSTEYSSVKYYFGFGGWLN